MVCYQTGDKKHHANYTLTTGASPCYSYFGGMTTQDKLRATGPQPPNAAIHPSACTGPRGPFRTGAALPDQAGTNDRNFSPKTGVHYSTHIAGQHHVQPIENKENLTPLLDTLSEVEPRAFSAGNTPKNRGRNQPKQVPTNAQTGLDGRRNSSIIVQFHKAEGRIPKC